MRYIAVKPQSSLVGSILRWLFSDVGVIEGYKATLNRRKLGLGVMAFVQIVCTQHSEEATAGFERIIQASPNVLACHNTTGEADFLLQVVARDLDDYSRFVETVLRKLPGVLSIRTNISLREMKTTNKLPITDGQGFGPKV